jgi:hypothetical protein
MLWQKGASFIKQHNTTAPHGMQHPQHRPTTIQLYNTHVNTRRLLSLLSYERSRKLTAETAAHALQ